MNCDSVKLAEWLRRLPGGRKEAPSLNRAPSDYDGDGMVIWNLELKAVYEPGTLYWTDIRNQHPHRLELDLDLSAGDLESRRRIVSRLASGLEPGAEVGGSGRRVVTLFRVHRAAR